MNILDRLNTSAGWNNEERMILEQVQRVADEIIAPNAEHADASGEFPWVSVNALKDLGLNMLFVPEEFGGAPMRVRLYLEVVKIISEACASTGIIYATNYHGMKPLIEFGNDAQRARLLPAIAEGGLGALAITEPSAGSDATGMKTRFTPDGDEIVIDGTCLLYTSDAADDMQCVDLGGRRISKKKTD